MNIIELRIRDIGIIEAFKMRPDGKHVVIGGPNDAGKSTVLRAIAGTLGGARERGEMPLRRSATDGEVVVDLGDYIVRWKTTDKGRDYLEIKSPDGATYPSPMALLGRLWGERSFNPLAFVAQKPSDQARTLAALAGVDLDAHDAQRKKIYDERTAVNREGKRLAAEAEGYEIPDGTPDEPIDARAMIDDLRAAERTNAQIRAARGELHRLDAEIEHLAEKSRNLSADNQERIAEAARQDEKSIADLERQIAELETRLERARTMPARRRAQEHAERESVDIEQSIAEATKIRAGIAEELEGQELVDTDEIERGIADAQETNRAVEMLTARRRVEAHAAERRAESKRLTAEIAEHDDKLRSAIQSADLPVNGLTIENGVVTQNGIPVSSLSSSARIRIGVALDIARHPDIGVILLDRWNDLDEERRKIVCEMCDAAGIQIIAATVGTTDPDISVVIREGRIEGGDNA